ncbi:FtsH protease activity modulator HflK [Marinihelvus fidelis]|uniref:Protein HflK n=1 Tax=Marinihelvus fidelis TaxID=2613842 RepID=A0A5N0TEV4_9GAMM|nr:FtsH protease activity modulator HflK [Marinihelvus fidelis]KAA9133108.1 FtsH protease activity modulator HflK [Marinihelvus fidelis]
MPWKEPGKGGKDPWKQGDQPPDLDEVFQNLSGKLRSLFGGGGGGGDRRSGSGSGGGSGVLPLVLLALVAWVGWDAVHIIDETERGVVQRFGKYTRELDPGINFTLPRPIESLTKVSRAVRSVEDQGHMLTEDENLVEFNYKIQYRVNDAQSFLFRVRDPEITLQQAAESALRESVGANGLDAILEGGSRDLVRLEAKRVLQDTLDNYQAGMSITEFNLVDVNVPPQVREAYSDVVRAREDRERFIEEARVHANSVIPEARGAAARIIEEATGYRDSTVALAEGEADRFSLLLEEYRQAPAVTRKRMYLQAMEGVLSRSSKVLLDVDSSGNILYLPLDQVTGGTSGEAVNRIPPVLTPQNSPAPTADRQDRNTRNANREGRQ